LSGHRGQLGHGGTWYRKPGKRREKASGAMQAMRSGLLVCCYRLVKGRLTEDPFKVLNELVYRMLKCMTS